MKIEEKNIILEPGDKFTGCGYTIEVREKETGQTEDRLTFAGLLDRFNSILTKRGYKAVHGSMGVYGYLQWSYTFTTSEYDKAGSWMFSENTYPIFYDYRGKDTSESSKAYNALVSWLMAFQLVELVPDAGKETNTQTELYRLAHSLSGGSSYPLYNGKAFKADPVSMREAAGVMYAICRKAYDNSEIDTFRSELGGKMIPASDFAGLGFKDHELSDAGGRLGYQVDNLGYLINTNIFLPSAPGPRVPDTTASKQPLPQSQGQPSELFNPDTNNYIIDEKIDDYVCKNFNCGAQTPLSEWNGYTGERRQKIVEAMAVPRCTFMYMFGARKYVRLVLQNGQLPIVNGYPRYVFEVVGSSDLYIDGPFGDLAGIYRYNVADSQKNARERFMDCIFGIADDGRFPTYDPNWGRKRPGGGMTRSFSSRSDIAGSPLNPLYNVDISCIVADTEEQRDKWAAEDGFATERPASYPSGHSAQIWMAALLLTQMKGGNTQEWVRKAYEYSVDRTIDRAHWNSDCIYGRLFGAMILPIINAMSGLRDGYKAMKEYVLKPEQGPMRFNLTIRNESSRTMALNGEILFVVANPDREGNYYGWQGCYNRTGRIRFSSPVAIYPGESATFMNVDSANDEIELRGRNPLDPSKLAETGKKANVMLYDGDGVSETYIPQNLSPDIIFTDGMELTVIYR